MNFILICILSLFFSSLAYSIDISTFRVGDLDDCNCTPPYQDAAHFSGIENLMAASALASAGVAPVDDITFQRRSSPNNLQRLLTIESDFKVPPIGANDKYFGHLYIAGRGVIRYRDQMLAQNHRKDERRTGDFYNRPYQAADINKPLGLDLIKQHGAIVNVKNVGSRPFNLGSGGDIQVKLKSPGSRNYVTAKINVAIRNGRATTTLISPEAGRVVFDTIKLRTGFAGIMGGIKKIEFIRGGRVAYTYNMP